MVGNKLNSNNSFQNKKKAEIDFSKKEAPDMNNRAVLLDLRKTLIGSLPGFHH